MGNTISVKPRESTKTLEITEKLIQDFQYHIKMVDRSMVSFARSIDSMRASCAVFQKDKKEAVDACNDDGIPRCTEAALLLETIDEVLSDHKFIALESISRLFSFISGMNGGYLSESEMIFSVDQYRLQKCEYAGNNVQYCDARIESLQRKLKRITTNYETAKEDIENFNRREELYQMENKILIKNLKELDTELSQIKSELQGVLNVKNDKQLVIEELKNELKNLQLVTEQMKYEITLERSSKSEAEKLRKAETDKCMRKMQTLEQNGKDGMVKIGAMQREIATLTEKNLNLNKVLSLERQAAVLLREEKSATEKKMYENLDQLKAYTKDLKLQHEKEIQTLTECLNHKHKANEEMTSKIKEANITQRQTEEDKNRISEQVSGLEATVQSLTSKLEIEIDTRQSRVEEKDCILKSLNDENEKMRKEIVELEQLHTEEIQRLAKSHVKEKNKKETCLMELDVLKENQSQVNDENKRLAEVIEVQKQEINALEIKLVSASKQIIYVQICHQTGFRAPKAEEELQHMLKTRMATEHINLQFLNCTEAFVLRSDLPSLIVYSRMHTYTRKKNISIATKGVKGTQKKMALLIFHERPDIHFQREMDSCNDAALETLCGIFDIGHTGRIYESEINSRNIERIIDFIKTEGLQQSI